MSTARIEPRQVMQQCGRDWRSPKQIAAKLQKRASEHARLLPCAADCHYRHGTRAPSKRAPHALNTVVAQYAEC
jgi:hypothetical protein